MKLLFCPHCMDVKKLHREDEASIRCLCGKSWGYYTDNVNAVYGGDAVMLGIDNYVFAHALNMQRTLGDREPTSQRGPGWRPGREFKAFIIPESAPTVRRE